jgi:DNA topoisomerase-1
MGTKDDEEKPRFAGLRPGQKMDKITLADAMELFKLPRTLGQTAEGEPIQTNIGRFGPYIKYGAKYVSLKEDDPYTVELPRALELIELKKIADANRIIRDFADEGIQVLNGRYGPYITDKTRNAKIPKDRDPKALTLEECKELLAQAPVRRGRRGRAPSQPAATPAPTATPPAEPVAPAAQPRVAAKKKTHHKARAKTRPAARPRKAAPQKPPVRRNSAARSTR